MLTNNFKNKQGITTITFSQDVQCFCPMGDDFYSAKVSVILAPAENIPDYCEVEKFMRALSGGKLILEDLVDTVYNELYNSLKPEYLKVSAHCDDAVHFEVTVEKES